MDIPFIILTFLACMAIGSQGHADHDKSWLMDIVSKIVCDRNHSYSSEKIAFSANLGQHYTTKGNDRLVFDQITLNQGNSYDGSTGIFTCKIPGVYQFNWFVHQTSGTAGLNLHLKQNDVTKFISYLNVSNGNLPGSAILNMRRGDKVWIKLIQGGRKLFAGTHTTFSGFLLYRNSE